MSRQKSAAFRVVRKSAYLSRKVFSKAANFSSRIEKKADRIIHGTDPTVTIHGKVLYEEIFAKAIPEIVPINPALPVPGRQATVTLLIPSLQKSSFFGGTATALIFAAHLALRRGLPLRIAETLKHSKTKNADLEEFFASFNIDFKRSNISLMNIASRTYNHYGYLDIHPDDIFVASAWWDAYLLQHLPLQRQFIYLIQDYEPIFYNNSDKFVFAESTYRKESFIPVCNTRLMYEFMKAKGYKYIAKNGLFFEPAVNVGVKLGINKIKTDVKKHMFLYGRPSVNRNLFYTAIKAINQSFEPGRLEPSEWEVFMGGEDKLPNILLDSGLTITNLGKTSLNEYYNFAKTVDVAVSLMMAPHPSYPPLELSSLGAAVVTTAYENKQDLGKYCRNILVSDIDNDSLVTMILQAASMPYETRIKNAQSCAIPSDWDDALKDTINKVIARL